MATMCTVIDPAAALLSGISGDQTARIVGDTLARFGPGAVRFAHEGGIRIIPLSLGQRYRDASASLRRLRIDVDRWPVPPAGLFVVEERTIYLRSASPMTVAHEFGHALDCALGGGVYRSGYDMVIRKAFAAARQFVTPYAQTGLDEYFAEAMRAYVEVNDSSLPWPTATRARLAEIDPTMHDYIRELFRTTF